MDNKIILHGQRFPKIKEEEVAEREKEKRKRVEKVSCLQVDIYESVCRALTLTELKSKQAKFDVCKPFLVVGGADLLKQWSATEALRGSMLKFNVFCCRLSEAEAVLCWQSRVRHVQC